MIFKVAGQNTYRWFAYAFMSSGASNRSCMERLYEMFGTDCGVGLKGMQLDNFGSKRLLDSQVRFSI